MSVIGEITLEEWKALAAMERQKLSSLTPPNAVYDPYDDLRRCNGELVQIVEQLKEHNRMQAERIRQLESELAMRTGRAWNDALGI